jgi:hypothetical protein
MKRLKLGTSKNSNNHMLSCIYLNQLKETAGIQEIVFYNITASLYICDSPSPSQKDLNYLFS